MRIGMGGLRMEARKIKDSAGQEYTVNFQWDSEANVWVATSGDITGLILESESLDQLMQRVMQAAPELIALNHLPLHASVRFSLDHAERIAFA